MRNIFKSRLGNFIIIFCYSIIIYLLVDYFKNVDWQKLMDTSINWKLLCMAVLCMLSLRFLYPAIWIFILKEFGQKITDYWGLSFVYAKAWLGRYIPGKIAWVGGKIYFGSQQGLDIKTLTLGSLLESVIQVTANLALGICIVGIYHKGVLGPKLTIFSLGALIILSLSIFPPFLNRILSLIFKVTKKKEINDKYMFRFTTLIKVFIMFVFVSMLSGIPFSLICKSVDSNFNIITLFFYLVGSASLAGSIGILAVFAPSGLGVREGVLAVLFSSLFPKEMVLILLIIIRLIATVVDIFFFVFSKLILFLRTT